MTERTASQTCEICGEPAPWWVLGLTRMNVKWHPDAAPRCEAHGQIATAENAASQASS